MTADTAAAMFSRDSAQQMAAFKKTQRLPLQSLPFASPHTGILLQSGRWNETEINNFFIIRELKYPHNYFYLSYHSLPPCGGLKILIS